MDVIPTKIEGAFLIRPKVFDDDRGFFLETWNRGNFAQAGIPADFVQDNFSRSKSGVLRGLHYQVQQPQGKLAWVVEGAVFDVVVDLRCSSSTFGQWESFLLNAEQREQIWVPPGCAHGFLVLSEHAGFCYKCSDYYAPQHERTLLWNDPALGIPWPDTETRPPALSSKDAEGLPWDACQKFA